MATAELSDRVGAYLDEQKEKGRIPTLKEAANELQERGPDICQTPAWLVRRRGDKLTVKQYELLKSLGDGHKSVLGLAKATGRAGTTGKGGRGSVRADLEHLEAIGLAEKNEEDWVATFAGQSALIDWQMKQFKESAHELDHSGPSTGLTALMLDVTALMAENRAYRDENADLIIKVTELEDKLASVRKFLGAGDA